MPNGQGVFIFTNGGFILGNFRNGQAIGICTLKYPNGDFLIGEFCSGYLHGKSIKYRLAQNTTRVEVYKNGGLKEILEIFVGPTLQACNFFSIKKRSG